MPEKSSGGWWKWLLLIVVLVLAVGGYVYYRYTHSEPLSFKTDPVVRGDVTQTVTATGTLNPVVNVTVGSQVSGRIYKLNVDYNSVVKANEIIAEIDPSTYQASVEQTKADLANAQANLELQQAEYRRSSELFTNKLISGSEYDTSHAALSQAQAQVQIKLAALSNALVNLNYCKIISPVDGVVILRAVELGQTVASSFNTPTIFQIANDLTQMQIDAAVAEADIGGVVEGQTVDFTVDAYPYRVFHGSVRQVRNYPTTSNNVVTYDVVISVTNADNKLKPGMTANVTIAVTQRDNVLLLKNAALRFTPPEMAVVLTNELAAAALAVTNAPAAAPAGRARNKPARNVRTVYLLAGTETAPQLKPAVIKTGITDGLSTEILEGLKEGDLVVSGLLNSNLPSAGGSNPFGGGFPRRR